MQIEVAERIDDPGAWTVEAIGSDGDFPGNLSRS